MRHMMFDSETWGTAPGSAFRSFGAAIFDPFASAQQNAASPSFYCNIDRASCEAIGLTVDPKTERWWDDQSPEAQAGFLTNQISIEAALSGFEQFWHDTRATFVWSFGANFDVVLFEEACRRANKHYRELAPEGLPPRFEAAAPWNYQNVRCARTVMGLAGIDSKNVRRVGVAHNALDDARTQINGVCEALRRMRVSASPNEMAARGTVHAAPI